MCGENTPSLYLASSTSCKPSPSTFTQDIEDLHELALKSKSTTYIDPKTGFTVFTEYAHLKKGKCCGFQCRHCPYGWENVQARNEDGKIVRRQPLVRSGDEEGCKRLIEKIESGQYVGQKQSLEFDSDDESDEEIYDQQINQNKDLHIIEGKKSRKKTGGRYGGEHTNKNVPYTRSGDYGTSQLLTGERRHKDDAVFEAMGTVDELCSVVGTAHAELLQSTEYYGELEEWLLDIMSRLFDIGSHIAKPKKEANHDDNDDDIHTTERTFQADGIGNGFVLEHINLLEDWIDEMTEELPELTSFILPTGSRLSAQLHVARCVCRRAERVAIPLMRGGVCDPNALKYLNRLSDFFFTAARWSNFCAGQNEVQYKRHIRGARQRNRIIVNLKEEKKQNT
jgi:cob(I)alamin adenosyltransferase